MIAILIALAGIVALVLLAGDIPSMLQSLEPAKEVYCYENVTVLGKALAAYSAEWHEFPRELDILVRDGRVSMKVLHCPSAATRSTIDYFYYPVVACAPHQAIVACDFSGNHPNGRRCVLYVDMRVEFMDASRFRAELAPPYNAGFADALRRAEERRSR